jgi:hypothetical protein
MKNSKMTKIEVNRPLFSEFAGVMVFCYNKWTIAPESVDELTGIATGLVSGNLGKPGR